MGRIVLGPTTPKKQRAAPQAAVLAHWERVGEAVDKPRECQKKAKALWAMKAAKDEEEEFYDPALKDNISGRNQTRLELWEEHLKDPRCSIGQSFEVLGDSVSRLTVGSRHFVESWFFQWPAAERAQAWCRRCGRDRCGKLFCLVWTRGIVCVYAQLPRIGTFRESMGRMASSSSSF